LWARPAGGHLSGKISPPRTTKRLRLPFTSSRFQNPHEVAEQKVAGFLLFILEF